MFAERKHGSGVGLTPGSVCGKLLNSSTLTALFLPLALLPSSVCPPQPVPSSAPRPLLQEAFLVLQMALCPSMAHCDFQNALSRLEMGRAEESVTQSLSLQDASLQGGLPVSIARAAPPADWAVVQVPALGWGGPCAQEGSTLRGGPPREAPRLAYVAVASLTLLMIL